MGLQQKHTRLSGYRKWLIAASITYLGLLNGGCLKDYSFEGALLDSAIVPNPSPPLPAPSSNAYPGCHLCIGLPPGSPDTWSFRVETADFCGKVVGAHINFNRTAFTFFGPSSCSGDTGLVMTVYLDNIALDQDRSGITTEKIVFEYYDNPTPSDIFISRPEPGFVFSIDQYNHSAGEARGHFNGRVYSTQGQAVTVSQGYFRIKFN